MTSSEESKSNCTKAGVDQYSLVNIQYSVFNIVYIVCTLNDGRIMVSTLNDVTYCTRKLSKFTRNILPSYAISFSSNNFYFSISTCY